MRLYDLGTQNPAEDKIPQPLPETGLFVICHAGEVLKLSKQFGWDESTARECVDLDETVRYAFYDGYDFISLIHMDFADDLAVQREINLFFSKEYLVLVLPDQTGARLTKMEETLIRIAQTDTPDPDRLARLYEMVFNTLAMDYSDMLEILEDALEALSEAVSKNPRHNQINELGNLRRAVYTARKILRAVSTVGAEVLADENALIPDHRIRYLKSIDARMKKLYDFAASLYELCGEVQNTYDSRLAIKMNENVNKLTVITLFFGPLTVITGIYGMNFTHMPELHWKLGYPIALGIMAAACLVVYLILKRKKWL